MQTGYCPRGPFCAFAHIQQEIRVVEDEHFHGDALMNVETVTEQDLMRTTDKPPSRSSTSGDIMEQQLDKMSPGGMHHMSQMNAMQMSNYQQQFRSNSGNFDDQNSINAFPSCPSPISKPMPNRSDFQNIPYPRAPGSGRSEGGHSYGGLSSSLGHSGSSPFPWGSLPINQNLGSFSSNGSSPNFNTRLFNALNSEATPFYPPDETVDSVVENALLEDIMDNCDISGNPDKNSAIPRSTGWPGLIGSGRDRENTSIYKMSSPMNIPQDNSLGNPNNFYLASPPVRSNSHQEYTRNIQGGSVPYMANRMSSFNQMPHHRHKERSLSGSMLTNSFSNSNNINEVEKMRSKCKQWEDCWNQAKSACDAWKQEATNANHKAKKLEEINQKTAEKIMSLEEQLKKCRSDLSKSKSELQTQMTLDNNSKKDMPCKFVHSTQDNEELKLIPVDDLKVLRKRVKEDLELIDQVLWVNHSVHGDEGWVSSK